MAKVFCVLLAVSIASAVQVSYVAPVASGYIYRSDNGGPASLIQLGAPHYAQRHAFAPPLPLAQSIPLEAYDLNTAALPYIADKPIVELDNEDEGEDSDEYLDNGNLIGLNHGHAHEKEAGSAYGEEHHAAHGEKGSKGYSSKDHHAEGESGHYGKEHDEGYHSEAEGEKGSHHDEADAHGKHHEVATSYKGGDKGHKKHFSKGEDVTGYHKVFHKDEFKKDHDFYDVADNSGHFNKYGNEKGGHSSAEGGHKEGGHSDGGFEKGEFGKAGFHAKGHHDESDNSHSAEEGNDSDFNHSEEYGKKGGSDHEKEYVYDDDDDDEEDDESEHE